MIGRLLLIAIFGLAFGCTSQPPAETDRSPSHKSEAERIVRAAIGDVFKVNPSAIDMNRPLSQAPLNADDLDLVELVMVVEERLGVVIPDERVEELSGGKLGKDPIRLTPAQLVRLAQEAKPSKKNDGQ
jgi:acyl carrier protein